MLKFRWKGDSKLKDTVRVLLNKKWRAQESGESSKSENANDVQPQNN